jgi:hypothetical protein
MKLGPGFHKPALSNRQGTRNQANRVETEDPNMLLIIGMKMGQVVWTSPLP